MIVNVFVPVDVNFPFKTPKDVNVTGQSESASHLIGVVPVALRVKLKFEFIVTSYEVVIIVGVS